MTRPTNLDADFGWHRDWGRGGRCLRTLGSTLKLGRFLQLPSVEEVPEPTCPGAFRTRHIHQNSNLAQLILLPLGGLLREA